MKTILRATLVLLLAAAALFGLYEGNASRQAGQRLAELLARHKRLLAAARKNNRGPEPTTANQDPLNTTTVRPRIEAAIQAKQEKIAETRKRYLAAYRASLDLKFGLLFQKLKLAPLTEESLKDLLTQREDDNLAVEAAARDRGVPTTDPEIEAMDDSLNAANKAAMADLIGHQGEREVHSFLQHDSVLPVVDQFTSGAAAAGDPITSDQALSLLSALSAASSTQPSGRVIKDTVNWSQLMAQVSSVLSPAQFAVLKLVQAQQEAHQQISVLVTQLNSGAK